MPGLRRYEIGEQKAPGQKAQNIEEKDMHVSPSLPSYGFEEAFSCGVMIQADSSLENSSWKDSLEIVAMELEEAGIKDRDTLRYLPAFLYSAWDCHAPLLLAGPCGDSIGDALSAAIYCSTAARIDCSYSYNPQIVEMMMNKKEEEVVIFENPFSGNWIDQIPSLLLGHEKHYILTCPFAEDLLLEPCGLFNYVMPVVTELFIDTTPNREFWGWIGSETFESYNAVNDAHPYCARLLKKLNISRLAENRMQMVLTNAHAILNDERGENVDMDFMLALFPYAYLTNQGRVLVDVLNEENVKVSAELRERILRFLGEAYE